MQMPRLRKKGRGRAKAGGNELCCLGIASPDANTDCVQFTGVILKNS